MKEQEKVAGAAQQQGKELEKEQGQGLEKEQQQQKELRQDLSQQRWRAGGAATAAA